MRLPKINLSLKSEDPQKSFVRSHPGLVLYLLITLLVIAVYLEQSSVFENIEYKIQDAMFSFRGSQKVSDEIVLLNIDNKALDYLGWWPWSHHMLAQMIEALDYYQPRVIYLNFKIDNNVDDYVSGNSQLLAENVLQSNNVILPFDVMLGARTPTTRTAPDWLTKSSLSHRGVVSSDQIEMASMIDLPEDIFGKAAKYCGASITYFEDDNSVRYQPLVVKYENKFYPSGDLLAAALYTGLSPENIRYKPGVKVLVGNTEIPVDSKGHMLINYPGENPDFPTYSIKDLWEGNVPVEALENKIVLVDLNATGHYDRVITPLSSDFTPGQKSATVIHNIIKGDFINSFKASASLEILIILGIGLFCAFLIPKVTLLHRFIILTVFLFVLININFILFSSFDTMTNTFYPALEIVLFMAAAPLMKSAGAQRKKKKQKQTEKEAEEKLLAEMKVVEQPEDEQKQERIESQPEPPVREIPAEPVNQENALTAHIDKHAESISEDDETVELSSIDHSVVKLEEPILADEPADEKAGDVLDQTPSPEPADRPPVAQENAQDYGSDKIKISFDESGRPRQFGRYKILEVLGQGAMGTVYKGEDPAIGRPVALKTIRFDRLANADEIEELKGRFMLEAKAAGNFSHPNIVTIYDVGQDRNIQYIAMEYLQGHTLDNIISRKLDLNYRIVASIVAQVCSALQYAHDRHVVHRDIKPANIMVMDGFQVKVMDFGIAHFESSNMTQTGVAMGTPNYISPEQLSGKEVTKSSDIFSLGVVMYELLTGKKPFAGENINNLILKILHENPTPISKIDDKVPPLMEHVVAKALEKDPLKRYHSASEMAANLADFVSSFSPKAARF